VQIQAPSERAMKRMTIGSLAMAGRTHVTTVRFYERAGLLPAPERTVGGHRNYSNDHMRRLLFIRRARELQFSIEEIRALLAFDEPTLTSCHEVHLLAATHLKGLRRKIADLMKLEALLAGSIAQCSGKTFSSCAVLQLMESTP
jgi:MerR family mercuric resistance operon transcriptional regulator